MKPTRLFETPYGYFREDGQAYVITQPDTPRPWVNVICPGDYGLVISQTSSGYSWRTHASLNRITRWEQDLLDDRWGKYLYVRDDASGAYWSAGWKPVCAPPQRYECVHGVGYTTITSVNHGIRTEWTVFVPPDESLELWRVRIKNVSRRTRRLSLWSFLEWCLGESPDSHREFHRLFIETQALDQGRLQLATKHLWTIKNAQGQHWNRSWEFVAWHGVSRPVFGQSGDKEAVLGRYRGVTRPEALEQGSYQGTTTSRWDDAIGSLAVRLALRPDEEQTVSWTVGCARSRAEATRLARRYRSLPAVEQAWNATNAFWTRWMDRFPVTTPDPAFNLMTNVWLKYQALSGRIWGRTAYYQMGGAYGFRDQLQDSQLFLPLAPDYTKRQIRLHAAHQFPDGTVFHWWHPLSEEGLPSRYADDLLWLPFVVVSYLKETAEWPALPEIIPFLSAGSAPSRATPTPSPRQEGTLYAHCCRAIDRALARLSPRGLPLILAGDWNDGLAVVGWARRGESLWLGHFLYGVLREWEELIGRGITQQVLAPSERRRALRYRRAATMLKGAINRSGWDGSWYWAATCDDGTVLGSRRYRDGKIHLNAQTWAVLNGVVPPARQPRLLRATRRWLYHRYGPLVLFPAYRTPDPRVGYLTRYAPGVRENGGVYTHAATWALQMECFLGNTEQAWDIYQQLCPPNRSRDIQKYLAEPYVTPGNSDGPDSPHYGRGGWTWYTGSAAWFYRVSTEWLLGIRPTWDGLIVQPCLPPHWPGFSATRVFRRCTYHIQVQRDRHLKPGQQVLFINGRPHPVGPLPLVPHRSLSVLLRLGSSHPG